MDKLDLKQWRGIRKMTIRELSEKSGVSKTTIAKFEKDPTKLLEARGYTVLKIAKALGIKASQLKYF